MMLVATDRTLPILQGPFLFTVFLFKTFFVEFFPLLAARSCVACSGPGPGDSFEAFGTR